MEPDAEFAVKLAEKSEVEKLKGSSTFPKPR